MYETWLDTTNMMVWNRQASTVMTLIFCQNLLKVKDVFLNHYQMLVDCVIAYTEAVNDV